MKIYIKTASGFWSEAVLLGNRDVQRRRFVPLFVILFATMLYSLGYTIGASGVIFREMTTEYGTICIVFIEVSIFTGFILCKNYFSGLSDYLQKNEKCVFISRFTYRWNGFHQT